MDVYVFELLKFHPVFQSVVQMLPLALMMVIATTVRAERINGVMNIGEEVNYDGEINDFKEFNNVFIPHTHHFPSSAARHKLAKRQAIIGALPPVILLLILNSPWLSPLTLITKKKVKPFKKLGKILFLKKLTLKTIPKKVKLVKFPKKKTKVKVLPVPLGLVLKKSKKGFKKSKKGLKKLTPVLFKKSKPVIKKSKPVIKKLKPFIKKGAKKVIKKGTAASVPISGIGVPGLGVGALSTAAVPAIPVIGAPAGFGPGTPIRGPGIGAPVGFGAGTPGVRLVPPGFVGATSIFNNFFN